MSIPKPISKPFVRSNSAAAPLVGSNCAAPPPIKIVTTVPATVTTSPISVQWINVPSGVPGIWGIDYAYRSDDAKPENKINKDGCTCKKCKEFYQYAEANQEDGTLICYGCRMRW